MVLDVEVGRSSEAHAGATGVLADGGFTVGSGALQEFSLTSLDLVVLATPGPEDGGLEGAAIGEGQGPRLLGGGALVDSVEVDSGVFLSLATGKESDAGNGSGHGTGEGGDGGLGNLLRGVLGGALGTGGYHVGLQEGSFEVYVVVVEGLVDEGKDSLSHLLGSIEVVFTIGKNFGLNNGDKAVHLADGSVSGQNIGVLKHSLVAGGVLADLEHTSPLGEIATVLLVLGAPLGEVIETLGGGFVLRAHKRDNALVNLDTAQDSLLLDELVELGAIIGLLVEGLVEQNYAGDVLGQGIIGSEEKLTVFATVFFAVFNINIGKSLANGTYGFIGG